MHERPLLSEMPRWLHEWPVRWEALGMRRKGVLVELPSKRALWLMWWAWREALPKILCVRVYGVI